eukprot:scaffold6177_cov134-Pinguiococcus_pyrenoidosus.AAC.1
MGHFFLFPRAALWENFRTCHEKSHCHEKSCHALSFFLCFVLVASHDGSLLSLPKSSLRSSAVQDLEGAPQLRRKLC